MKSHPEFPHLPHPEWVAEQLRRLGLDKPAPSATVRQTRQHAPAGSLRERWQAALDAADLEALKTLAREYHKTFHALPEELRESGNGILMHNIGHYKFPDALTDEALAALRELPVPADLPKSIKRGPGYAAP